MAGVVVVGEDEQAIVRFPSLVKPCNKQPRMWLAGCVCLSCFARRRRPRHLVIEENENGFATRTKLLTSVYGIGNFDASPFFNHNSIGFSRDLGDNRG